MDIIINETFPVLLPTRGLVTIIKEHMSKKPINRQKRAIPVLAIIQGATDIGSVLIKGINAIADAK